MTRHWYYPNNNKRKINRFNKTDNKNINERERERKK